MKKLSSFLIILGGLCLGLLAPLYAQKPASAAPAPPTPALLRFLFLDEREGSYFLKLANDQYESISSAPYAISNPYQPADFAPLEIYRARTGAMDSVTGQPVRVKVATVTPSAKITSTLIVVTPVAATAEAPVPVFKVTEFDTDPRSFPVGSIRMINLGRAPLGASFRGASPVLVQPGETSVVPLSPDTKNRVATRIAVQEPTGWRILSNRILTIRPAQRLTGVFIFSPSGLRHTLTAEEIAEFGPPKPGHFWLTFAEAL